MFIVKSPYIFNSQLDADSVGKLGPISDIMPNFVEVVKENMLWGIFADQDVFSLSKNLPKDHAFKPQKHYDSIFCLSYSFIDEAKTQVKENFNIEDPKFFALEVEQAIIDQDLAASVDYEDCEVNVSMLPESKTWFNKNEVAAIISPTLPDSDVVFRSLVKGSYFDAENTWILQYMDAYEEWKREVMDDLYKYYIQIGGHGRWIQSDYNNTYVAQVNNNMGDCGSVFISIQEGEATGYVDMH